jgi:hypothetical protein
MPGAPRTAQWNFQPALVPRLRNEAQLLRVAKPTTPRRSRFAPVRLEDLKDLELEVDVARRLWLAVIAHICLVLPVFAICSLVRFW